MSFGTGAGKGDLPRAVKGEAFRKAYESIVKPGSLDDLLEKFYDAVDNRQVEVIEDLHTQIKAHPYYRGKP